MCLCSLVHHALACCTVHGHKTAHAMTAILALSRHRLSASCRARASPSWTRSTTSRWGGRHHVRSFVLLLSSSISVAAWCHACRATVTSCGAWRVQPAHATAWYVWMCATVCVHYGCTGLSARRVAVNRKPQPVRVGPELGWEQDGAAQVLSASCAQPGFCAHCACPFCRGNRRAGPCRHIDRDMQVWHLLICGCRDWLCACAWYAVPCGGH